MPTIAPLELIPVPAFADNYLWTLVRGIDAVVVDPGDAVPVEKALADRGLRLVAILVTHHHPDHIGGVKALRSRHDVPVYGPKREATTIKELSVELVEGDHVELIGRRFEVIEVPGHTLGHIAYFAAANDLEGPILLCGDTLFSAGCGRLFEGTPAQMHDSLSRLAALPPATQVYCTHEYTMSNLAFAQAVEPGNQALQDHVARVRQLRGQDRPSLPSSIELELRINPFLRTDHPSVRAAATARAGHETADPIETFATLRAWKDVFRPPASV
ncbi:hydroxyacylglutathione hydrolase [Panacagrimonas perspica]|uniref:Hydroxyacylglutathione hydrolase n=1 Tax=Panacagrimonas perspica TaxID=381431 RepID=A0A4R7P9R1_9GAMM|nr:hydroxyacylglutathione hydrolase [Panacagrimonas perspica]TDU30724.1 hydroxyacylglutathione hydrolase [Panacagrimonas perspica]THD01549.1 hydroxyacylglutathione hydrolase [Panacagrimonas perspica]